MSIDLYGKGAAYPLEVDGAGALKLSAGDVRILESIDQIITTPRGTCPMDPEYGLDLDAYDPITQPDLVGWRIADAIDRSEPRIQDLEVAIVEMDLESGTLFVDVRVVPIGSNRPINRVFPLYVRA